ncbi:eukaryotic aspartyl protease family protein [Wolffia australiana]
MKLSLPQPSALFLHLNMASPNLSFILVAALVSFLFLADSASSLHPGSTLSIIHAQGSYPPQLSWSEYLGRISSNDASRFLYLSNLAVSTTKKATPIASGFQNLHLPNYLVKIAFGNPPQPLTLALDTSNDVAWVPCPSCSGCPPSFFFNTAKSPSFKPLRCGDPRCQQVPNPTCEGTYCFFNMSYGGANFNAALSRDTLHIAGDDFQNYVFGCLRKVISGSSLPPQGLLGLGRGPNSLTSQTQETYRSTFSYCLPSIRSRNFSGSLRLGPVGQPINIKTTPLLPNPRRPTLYYVNMTGIVVGRRRLAIPPEALTFDPATGAGTVFDSGTMFSRLVAPAYAALRQEFRRRVAVKNVTSVGGFDTCYEGPIIAPNITFLFDGMNVTLGPENTLIHSSFGNTVCLAMAASPDNVNSGLNVIAGMQQQNHRVLIDLPGQRLGVAREPCTV